MEQSYAKVRNVSGVATTMYSACGDTVQINAGFHGKVEAKFLHDYDTSAIVVTEHPAAPKTVVKPVALPDNPPSPIDASAKPSVVIDASTKK